MRKKVCLIGVPACNEGTSLKVFLPRLLAVTSTIKDLEFDVCVVDDGSNDDTQDVVLSFGDRVKLLSNNGNIGLGYSLRRLYERTVKQGYDYLVTMDSDGQHDVNLLEPILARLRVDDLPRLVIGSRYHPESERYGTPLDRDLLNVAFTAIIRSVTKWKDITDPLSGFWAMPALVASFLGHELKLERYGTCLEGLVKLSYLFEGGSVEVVEVPHPAIYQNHSELGLLNREYSPSNKEDRVERFGTHALHVLSALEDVKTAGFGQEVDVHLKNWRCF